MLMMIRKLYVDSLSWDDFAILLIISYSNDVSFMYDYAITVYVLFNFGNWLA